MSASEAGGNTEITENWSTEPSLTEIREMSMSIANILKESKSVKIELTELTAEPICNWGWGGGNLKTSAGFASL